MHNCLWQRVKVNSDKAGAPGNKWKLPLTNVHLTALQLSFCSSSSATQALTDIEALRARMAELQIRLQEATNSQQEDEENKRVHKNTIKVWLNVNRTLLI